MHLNWLVKFELREYGPSRSILLLVTFIRVCCFTRRCQKKLKLKKDRLFCHIFIIGTISIRRGARAPLATFVWGGLWYWALFLTEPGKYHCAHQDNFWISFWGSANQKIQIRKGNYHLNLALVARWGGGSNCSRLRISGIRILFSSCTIPWRQVLMTVHIKAKGHILFCFSDAKCIFCLSDTFIVLLSRDETLGARDVETVKFLMLPLPAPLDVLCFRVRFGFQSLSSKCFRFQKNLTASNASACSFRFHISAQYETANCI